MLKAGDNPLTKPGREAKAERILDDASTVYSYSKDCSLQLLMSYSLDSVSAFKDD